MRSSSWRCENGPSDRGDEFLLVIDSSEAKPRPRVRERLLLLPARVLPGRTEDVDPANRLVAAVFRGVWLLAGNRVGVAGAADDPLPASEENQFILDDEPRLFVRR